MGESEEVRRHREDNMHGEVDDKLISAGWSITVGELKRALADVPDDYEVMLTCAEVDDTDICDVRIDGMYPPALGSPGIFRLGGGQIVNSEYAYHERMDAHHEVGGDLTWTTWGNPEGEWKRQ
jgi:hypothetical protein